MKTHPLPVLQTLTSLNDRYSSFRQQQSDSCAHLEKLGHPHAATFRRLRNFFDGLRFACNAGTRVFSYRDENNLSEYKAPSLELTSHPSAALAQFSRIYPSSEDWLTYCTAAAAAGWVGAEPRLECGQWSVHSTDPALQAALCRISWGDRRAKAYSSGMPTQFCFHLGTDPSRFDEIEALLLSHHSEFILPKRTAADQTSDDAPLPLSQKTLLLANVKKVTVTDRHVLVPLLPLGGDNSPAIKASEEVVELLKEGLPLAQALPWLSKFLTKQAIRRLTANFA